MFLTSVFSRNYKYILLFILQMGCAPTAYKSRQVYDRKFEKGYSRKKIAHKSEKINVST